MYSTGSAGTMNSSTYAAPATRIPIRHRRARESTSATDKKIPSVYDRICPVSHRPSAAGIITAPSRIQYRKIPRTPCSSSWNPHHTTARNSAIDGATYTGKLFPPAENARIVMNTPSEFATANVIASTSVSPANTETADFSFQSIEIAKWISVPIANPTAISGDTSSSTTTAANTTAQADTKLFSRSFSTHADAYSASTNRSSV